ncbi:MAG: HAD family phosphatase [Lachnospiraceae bacterium]|nr:HAD family phosphatase [Lachnospiraceae bacterium]
MAEKRYQGFIGLDLDGTVFNNEKKISEGNKKAIREAIKQGYCVAPVTGRPMTGLPEELMDISEIEYAVTANGAVIYQIEDFSQKKWNRIYEDLMTDEKVLEILEILKEYPVVPDCFVMGKGHMPEFGREWIPRMGLAPAMADYILSGREFFPDLMEYVRKKPEKVEKVTINFFQNTEGLKKKQEVYERLSQVKDITLVSGAPHNLEVNTPTARKGNGLLKLAQLLGIPEENTMACGDDSNDLDMLQKAAFGVAMGNATENVKKEADFVTLSNEEDGVAFAIGEFMKGGRRDGRL